MTRKTALLTIVMCVIVGAGCALPSNPPPNRVDTLPANSNTETRMTEAETENLRVQRAAKAAKRRLGDCKPTRLVLILVPVQVTQILLR